MTGYKMELSDAIKKVSEELSAMPDKEFFAELEKHKDGDIAKILIEANTIL